MRILIILVTIFLFANQVQAGLFDRLKTKIERFRKAREHILSVFHHIGHDPNSTILAKVYPEAALLVSNRVQRLEQCYNASLGNQKVSIFEVPLGTVVHDYLEIFFDHHYPSLVEIEQKVRNLIANIRSIARMVIDCVKNDDPDFRPTTLGLTKFAAMSSEEISQIYQKPLPEFNPMGRNIGEKLGETINTDNVPLKSNIYMSLPDTYDYRDQGVVSEIKDQSTCGTCFLFGALASIESSYMLKHGKTGISFSEQNLFDCMYKDRKYTNSTCMEGGFVYKVFHEAKKRGVTLHENGEEYTLANSRYHKYPFHPKECGKYPVVTKVTKYASSQNVRNDEKILKSVLMKYGPITVLFRTTLIGDTDTDHKFFTITDKMNTPCDSSAPLDHVMAVVGWTEDYWILKNSYGNHKQGESETYHAYLQPFGVDGWLYLRKSLARGCGIFGPGSSWFFPEVE